MPGITQCSTESTLFRSVDISELQAIELKRQTAVEDLQAWLLRRYHFLDHLYSLARFWHFQSVSRILFCIIVRFPLKTEEQLLICHLF